MTEFSRRPAFICIAVSVAVLAGLFVGGSVGGVAAAAGTPIKVGVIADNETPCEEPGTLNTAQNTLKAWASSVNSKGGLAGHPVHLTILNTQCSPSVTLSDANQLVSQHVIAIIDNSNTNNDYASVVDAAHIPVICGPSSGNGLYCSSDANFFPSGTTEFQSGFALTNAAKKAGAHTYGFLYCTEVATCKQAVAFLAEQAKSAGLKYYSVAASETAPNYTAQCLAMQHAGVDALFVGGPPALTVADNCATQNYHPIYIQAVGTWTSAYLKNPNMNHSTGETGDVPWSVSNTPATKAFEKTEGHVLASSRFPYEISATYAAGLLLQAALAHAPANPTSQDVYNGLYALKGSTLGGFTPPLTFTPGKPHTVGCFYIMSIKNGKWFAPYGGKYFCQGSQVG